MQRHLSKEPRMRTHLTGRVLLAVALFFTSFGSHAADAAGKVVMLVGNATALGPDGVVRKLAKEQAIYPGDLINSGTSSYVNIRFTDNSFFLLRPDTRFQVEEYHLAAAPDKPAAAASPKPAAPAADKPAADRAAATPLVTASADTSSGTSRAFFRLLKGSFRTVSGLIGKVNHDDYRVATPVATIGIRGTKYSGTLCQGECSDRYEITTKLRQRGASPKRNETVLITTVESGEIEIGSVGKTMRQGVGTVFFTTETGVITPVDEPPQSIQADQNLQPESCGQ